MKQRIQKSKFSLVYILIFLFSSLQAQDEKASQLLALSLEELLQVKVNVGSRSESRTLFNSMTPIDIITYEQISESGLFTLGEILQYYVPEFNYPHPSVADGTDHIWPGTLIGLNPDHVLVLINGKRWHHSALLNVNGTVGRGSTGPDYNAIPLQAIERIEILKDGASAQYGSDAIAGIINIILKEEFESSIFTGYSETSRKDGEFRYLSENISVPSSGKSLLSIIAEYRDKGNVNRAQPDPRPFYFDGDPRNDDPAIRNLITHRFGDAKTRDYNLLFNWNYHPSSDFIYFMLGKLTFRKGESSGFYRRPRDDRNVRAIYPDGFLPLIVPDMTDIYTQLGIKNKSSRHHLEASLAMGQNVFAFNVKNSLNVSMGTNSPTEFYCGTLSLHQLTSNIDFTIFSEDKSENLSMGSEFRFEKFWIKPGEEASYEDGGIPILDGPNAGNKAPIGAQVFPGFRPENVVNRNRWSISFYSEYLHHLNRKLSYSLAVRYENYSDFGNSLNGKLQLRYEIIPELAFRTSIGTGFRAPSLQQSYYNSTATGWVEGELRDLRLLRVDHPLARKLGASPLKPEKAKRINVGIAYQKKDQIYAELNVFGLDLKDRIVLTGEFINDSTLFGSQISAILEEFHTAGARFFTNSVNTFTKGANGKIQFLLRYQNKTKLQIRFAHQWNQTEIIGDINTPEILKNYGTTILDADERNRITEAQPHHITHFSLMLMKNRWNAIVKFIRFGSFNSNKSDGSNFQRMGARLLTFIRLNYFLNKHLQVFFALDNVFDVYPEKNRGNDLLSVIFPYSLNSPFGYKGRSYTFQFIYTF